MLESRPKVSLVIPAYNHAGFLPEAIESVLAQDYPHIELIVLDDGSTDSTRDVLMQYGGRFLWESHANMGQAATLNKGWRISNGELLGYLSADDHLRPDAVSTTVATLCAHPEAVVAYCDFELVDPRGKLIRQVRAAEFSLEDMLTKFACPPGPGALFRRSAFEAAGGWNPSLKLMPDFDYWLRLARRGPFIRIPRALAAWRAHEASQSFGAVTHERAREPINIINDFFSRDGLASEIRALENRSLARAHLVSCQLHARSARFGDAGRAFLRACKISPGILLLPETWRLVVNALINRPAHRFLWAMRSVFDR